jgi:hypothetical protein
MKTKVCTNETKSQMATVQGRGFNLGLTLGAREILQFERS